jgi:hypothetical protein
MVLLIVLKLSACGFGAESDAVRRVAINFAQSNRVNHSCSKNVEGRILIGSKHSVCAHKK